MRLRSRSSNWRALEENRFTSINWKRRERAKLINYSATAYHFIHHYLLCFRVAAEDLVANTIPSEIRFFLKYMIFEIFFFDFFFIFLLFFLTLARRVCKRRRSKRFWRCEGRLDERKTFSLSVLNRKFEIAQAIERGWFGLRFGSSSGCLKVHR